MPTLNALTCGSERGVRLDGFRVARVFKGIDRPTMHFVCSATAFENKESVFLHFGASMDIKRTHSIGDTRRHQRHLPIHMSVMTKREDPVQPRHGMVMGMMGGSKPCTTPEAFHCKSAPQDVSETYTRRRGLYQSIKDRDAPIERLHQGQLFRVFLNRRSHCCNSQAIRKAWSHTQGVSPRSKWQNRTHTQARDHRGRSRRCCCPSALRRPLWRLGRLGPRRPRWLFGRSR